MSPPFALFCIYFTLFFTSEKLSLQSGGILFLKKGDGPNKNQEGAMKIHKRFATIGGTLAVVMVFAVLAIAETGCTRFGPFGGGPLHRWHAGDMPERMLKRMDAKVKDLNLTAVQQAKYDELRARVKEQVQAAKEDKLQFREIARTELAKDAPDIAVLNAMMKKKIERASLALQNDLDLFASFYSTLDKDQKQKVGAAMRKRMAARDARREDLQ